MDALRGPGAVTDRWGVAGAAVVGVVGNEVVARYRIRGGRRIGSAALVADGLHARTDGSFRTRLVTAPAAVGVITGLGVAGYLLALEYLIDRDQ